MSHRRGGCVFQPFLKQFIGKRPHACFLRNQVWPTHIWKGNRISADRSRKCTSKNDIQALQCVREPEFHVPLSRSWGLQTWCLTKSPWRARECVHRRCSSKHWLDLVSVKPSCHGTSQVGTLLLLSASSLSFCSSGGQGSQLGRMKKKKKKSAMYPHTHPSLHTSSGLCHKLKFGKKSYFCFKIDVYYTWPDLLMSELRHWQLNVITQCFYYLRRIRKVMILPESLILGQKVNSLHWIYFKEKVGDKITLW